MVCVIPSTTNLPNTACCPIIKLNVEIARFVQFKIELCKIVHSKNLNYHLDSCRLFVNFASLFEIFYMLS